MGKVSVKGLKKLRFAVLERDGFKCRYCGISGQDAVLHVDHIVPKCDGGADNIDNLITACVPCNRGKGHRGLVVTDSTHPSLAAIAKKATSTPKKVAKKKPLIVPARATAIVNLRISEEESREFKRLAKKYAGGNVSLFVRYAALNFDPALFPKKDT